MNAAVRVAGLVVFRRVPFVAALGYAPLLNFLAQFV